MDNAEETVGDNHDQNQENSTSGIESQIQQWSIQDDNSDKNVDKTHNAAVNEEQENKSRESLNEESIVGTAGWGLPSTQPVGGNEREDTGWGGSVQNKDLLEKTGDISSSSVPSWGGSTVPNSANQQWGSGNDNLNQQAKELDGSGWMSSSGDASQGQVVGSSEITQQGSSTDGWGTVPVGTAGTFSIFQIEYLQLILGYLIFLERYSLCFCLNL